MRSVSRTCRVSDSDFRLGLFAWDKVENHACHRRREHQVLPFNPASSVRGPKHVVKTGKTPVLSAKETSTLLDGIDVSTVVGLRDRAFLGVLVYSFARVGAAVSLRVADYYTQGPRSFFRLHREGRAVQRRPRAPHSASLRRRLPRGRRHRRGPPRPPIPQLPARARDCSQPRQVLPSSSWSTAVVASNSTFPLGGRQKGRCIKRRNRTKLGGSP